MAILRSAFWLGVAFVAIGPNTDWGQNARSAAQSALGATTAVAQDQISAAECSNLVCTTQKVMVAHSLNTLNEQVSEMIGANDNGGARIQSTQILQPIQILVPNPAPRLVRR